MARAGNPGAFETIVDRYQGRLLGFCRQMLGSTEDAEDVLQEVFVNAYRAMLADEREINLRPWLYRIARNRCLNHLRKPTADAQESMDMVPAVEASSTAEKVHNREEFRQILSDVNKLPETQRSALLLREMDALSYEEIAAAMETTVPSVKSLLVRARISLAEASQARLLTCGEVRVELSEAAEGLRKVSAPVRRHVRECDECADFRSQVRSNEKALAALFPVGPLIALKGFIASKLGLGGAGAGAGAAAAGSGRRGRRGRRCRRRRRRRAQRRRRGRRARRDRRRDRHQGRRRRRHRRRPHRRRRGRGQAEQRPRSTHSAGRQRPQPTNQPARSPPLADSPTSRRPPAEHPRTSRREAGAAGRDQRRSNAPGRRRRPKKRRRPRPLPKTKPPAQSMRGTGGSRRPRAEGITAAAALGRHRRRRRRPRRHRHRGRRPSAAPARRHRPPPPPPRQPRRPRRHHRRRPNPLRPPADPAPNPAAGTPVGPGPLGETARRAAASRGRSL